MPLRTNVGINRKVTDSNYGSRGASVNLEVELDSSLIQEPERLQERIRQVFRLAQQAVDEELARQQPNNGTATDTTGVATNNAAVEPPRANGNGSNGNGATGHRNGHSASEKQMTYARQLAGQIKGVGIRRLENLAQKMFGRPLAALTSLDASGLIDTLKSIKAGEIDAEAVLSEKAQ